MKTIIEKLLADKSKTVPVLSFPSTQLLGITVNELISSAEKQAEGMKAIAKRCPVGAVLNMMDLSVEAEAFGCKIRFSDNEIPTVSSGAISDISQAAELSVPAMGAGRTAVYAKGIELAKQAIKDVPVFCGAIGPYSLAGRIFDMTELMLECYDSPEDVTVLLEKATEFIVSYVTALKAAGADGVILAEPAAGLLSPALADEFSTPFVKKIIDAVSDDRFVVCYHNCGGTVVDMAASLASLGADIYHFGNAISLEKIIPLMPAESIVMGNVNPLLFRSATPNEVGSTVESVYKSCAEFGNFMLSTGCDVPADAKWENLDAYFEKVNELYS